MVIKIIKNTNILTLKYKVAWLPSIILFLETVRLVILNASVLKPIQTLIIIECYITFRSVWLTKQKVINFS